MAFILLFVAAFGSEHDFVYLQIHVLYSQNNVQRELAELLHQASVSDTLSTVAVIVVNWEIYKVTMAMTRNLPNGP